MKTIDSLEERFGLRFNDLKLEKDYSIHSLKKIAKVQTMFNWIVMLIILTWAFVLRRKSDLVFLPFHMLSMYFKKNITYYYTYIFHFAGLSYVAMLYFKEGVTNFEVHSTLLNHLCINFIIFMLLSYQWKLSFLLASLNVVFYLFLVDKQFGYVDLNYGVMICLQIVNYLYAVTSTEYNNRQMFSMYKRAEQLEQQQRTFL